MVHEAALAAERRRTSEAERLANKAAAECGHMERDLARAREAKAQQDDARCVPAIVLACMVMKCRTDTVQPVDSRITFLMCVMHSALLRVFAMLQDPEAAGSAAGPGIAAAVPPPGAQLALGHAQDARDQQRCRCCRGSGLRH